VPAPFVSLERRDLAQNVGDYGRTASMYKLLSQAGRFGLSAPAARGISGDSSRSSAVGAKASTPAACRPGTSSTSRRPSCRIVFSSTAVPTRKRFELAPFGEPCQGSLQ